MSNFKDRFVRAMRANLNDVLDRVKEFEDRGGFESLLDSIVDGEWEEASGRRPGGQSRRPPNVDSGDKTIRQYYANLEVPYGADLDTVKESYRRLMRRYHPDRYAHDDKMQKKATELSQELTQAYTAIRQYLKEGRY